MTYHCSIYAIEEVEVEPIDFSPFSCAEEMVMTLGIPVEEWLKRQQAKREAKLRRKQKKSVFDEI